MKLADILDMALEAAGLSLNEDEDFLYLKKGDTVLEVWYAIHADKDSVRKTVAAWVIVYKREGGKVQPPLSLEFKEGGQQ
jgi:hypothetical protein